MLIFTQRKYKPTKKLEIMSQKFEVTSGKMILSDPCYVVPTWCQGVVDNVKNGTWVGRVEQSDEGDWGVRNSLLMSINLEAISKMPLLEQDLFSMCELLPFECGVDSGQFGHFDFANYRKDELAVDLEKAFDDTFATEVGDEWYRAVCNITLTNDFGSLPYGVVSSSGFGDGSYNTYGIKDSDGLYVGFLTIFIDDQDQDDYIMSEYDEESDEQ
jgi:hypothetical protein